MTQTEKDKFVNDMLARIYDIKLSARDEPLINLCEEFQLLLHALLKNEL